MLKVTAGLADNVANFASLGIGKLVIKGDIDGSAGGAEAGLVKINGGIGEVIVKGSVIGGADRSGIVSNRQLGSVKIAGDVRSANPNKPVTISALGVQGSALVLAIKKLTIAGDVENAQILAGYRTGGAAQNPDASIGQIIVKGNWSASSVAAGIADSTGDGFGQNDTLIPGDTTPAQFSKIASIVIAGTATGSTAGGDFFGITAQEVGTAKIHHTSLAFTPNKDDLDLDPVNGDFRLVEV